jgi:tRNA (mo5U34)-methyltransferase
MLPSLMSEEEFQTLERALAGTGLASWGPALPAAVAQATAPGIHGSLPAWLAALEGLPALTPSSMDFSCQVRIGAGEDAPAQARVQLAESLKALMPWRKGPFTVFGLEVDAEWRCDLKWARALPHISTLAGRRVLDVGCGNGYYSLRMLGQDPALVLGLDPYLLYFMQFRMLRRYLPVSLPVHVLPLPLEALPQDAAAFDTVFSMGVLYHRRSPIDHLAALRKALRGGGELVLETLIIEGTEREVLVPPGRYASMRNVWFLPSADALTGWLERLGFTEVREVDRCRTTPAEQRSTDWMPFRSLADFLDPEDPSRTREGHPAPLRSVFIATSP